jgi:saccharopine dehydrogenase-like NADP-dependent oxidoreductase
MRDLDDGAKNAGVLLLNEIGLDPGIDHMSAMRVIDGVKKKDGKIVSFRSTTGALPSHEANTNPFGYKFSWSPRGVLLASKNPSKWLENGTVFSYSGEELFENYIFENYILQDVLDVGTFENYPNRDSISYKEIYGLKDAKTVYRGTFRMTGWCETMKKIVELGWLSEELPEGFIGKTYSDLTKYFVGIDIDKNLVNATASFLGLAIYSTVIKKMKWLGLFSNEKLPKEGKSPIDFLNILMRSKMSLGRNERDMIIMHHEFEIEFGNESQYITSTLISYGIPNLDTAVARTVALPAAIAVKLILNGKINLTGVHIPVLPEIYNPILDELELIDIKFKEVVKEF